MTGAAAKFKSCAESITMVRLAWMTESIRSFLVHMELLIRQTFSRSAPGFSVNEKGTGAKKGVPRETSGLLEPNFSRFWGPNPGHRRSHFEAGKIFTGPARRCIYKEHFLAAGECKGRGAEIRRKSCPLPKIKSAVIFPTLGVLFVLRLHKCISGQTKEWDGRN